MTATGWLEAKTTGAAKYNTGKACKYGHFSDRFASTGACCECSKRSGKEKPANDNRPAIGAYFQWEGVEASKVRRLLYLSRNRARQADIPHTLSTEDFVKLWDRAAGRCEFSGIQFQDLMFQGCTTRPFAPSIDRINSSKGYAFSNCRIVCNIVNIALRDFGDGLLDEVCRARVARLGPAPYRRSKKS